jgi:sortase B
MSISIWEVGKKQYTYIQGQLAYKKAQKEMNKLSRHEYVKQKDFDWITINNTAINYPLVGYDNNDYYLTHNYLGEENISGAIYYDAEDEPYNGRSTVIFGHSMKDGTMFNNLHFFRKDNNKFRNSELIITTKNGDIKYKPLGYAIYNGKDPFYRNIDNMNINEALGYLDTKCNFFIQPDEVKENQHIISLVTCDYTINNGRLVVFYISE